MFSEAGSRKKLPEPEPPENRTAPKPCLQLHFHVDHDPQHIADKEVIDCLQLTCSQDPGPGHRAEMRQWSRPTDSNVN